MRITRCRIYFIPPTQSDEATTGDILQVVKIGSEEQDGYYKDHDTIQIRGSIDKSKGAEGIQVFDEEHSEEVYQKTRYFRS